MPSKSVLQVGEIETVRRVRRADQQARGDEEVYVHRDMGCDRAPSCLACPFARCRYDLTPRERAAVAIERRRA